MLKIHLEQNMNFQLKKEKIQAYRIKMILKLLFNTQMIWMIFIKTLKDTTQIRNVKY